MALKNCWEIRKCGREQGGARATELGVCPAYPDRGHSCWLVAGTLCGDEVQGTFAPKELNCLKCEVYNCYNLRSGTEKQQLVRECESEMILSLDYSPQYLANQTSEQLLPAAAHEMDRTMEQRAQARARELIETNKLLQEQNMKLYVALQNMSQGLAMYGRDNRLIVSNQKYAELYGLSSELIKPGMTLREILELRVTNGIILPSQATEYVKDRVAVAMGRAASDTMLELSDGRTLAVAVRPLANGGCVMTHEDITARRQAEAQLAHMARHDVLTDLPNRMLLRERLDQALARVHRGEQVAVLYLDLDDFKGINDALGHDIGDKILQAVADRLRGCVRDTDTIARLGGDEFAIIQTGLEQLADTATLAMRIRGAITPLYEIDDHQILTDVSIGISIAPSDASEPDQLLKNADMALYRAKAEGHGTFRFFEPQMDERVKARRSLELDLRRAVVSDEFELYYQPKVNLARNQISGCEALLRWHHPERGLVSPIEFIPLAEKTGLINQIGEWVLRQSCLEAATWPDDIAVAVNLSPVQFRNQGLAQLVLSALATSGLPARRLEVEITEAALLQNNEATLATLHRLHDLGVDIVMDDFGIGYSSLSYLRSFPFDKIKIDRSFITDIAEKEDSRAIVRAVTGLASHLRMTTIAEGVETQRQLDMIAALGCTEMQGYLYSGPVPARDLVRLFPVRQSKTVSAAA